MCQIESSSSQTVGVRRPISCGFFRYPYFCKQFIARISLCNAHSLLPMCHGCEASQMLVHNV